MQDERFLGSSLSIYYRLNKDSVLVFLVVSVPSFSHSYNSYEILKFVITPHSEGKDGFLSLGAV